MERNLNKIGLVNLIVLLVVGAAGVFLSLYSNTLAGQAGMVFLGFGFLAVLVSYFQMRLEERERLEQLEFEELTKSKSGTSMFNTTDAEVFPARHARSQFERIFVPAFTALLFVLQVGAVYWGWRMLDRAVVTTLTQPMLAMSLFAMFALILFLLGKYSATFSRLEKQRLLRPGASYLLLGSYVSFIVAACIAAVQMGFVEVDRYAAYVFLVFLAILAVETMINLILEIYRPRRKGEAARLLYDSRLVGLVSQPESLLTTAAHALDYQFGFKVSETWVYRFLQRALGWLILIQIGALAISSCFVFISPGEQGLIERFGRPVEGRAVLNPGMHVKWPWPMDKVLRFRTHQIQKINIGFVPHEEEHDKVVLWNIPHYQEEFNMLVASREGREMRISDEPGQRGAPADLLTVSIPVQYQINDLHAWAYNHTNAGDLLDKIANREVVRFMAGSDLFEIMSMERSAAALYLQDRIQERADELSMGVQVVFVGLQDIHPPVKVAEHFQNVVGARQQNEARLHEAEGYAARVVPMSRAEAGQRVREAEAYRFRKIELEAAQASQITNRIAAYNASPEVFINRAYLQALTQGTANARKYVLMTTNQNEILNLNLEDRVHRSLLGDVAPPTTRR
jgi:modulator of FtsH protease HflK